MRKKGIKNRTHLRALLTDTLPYETPFFFSNERLLLAASNEQLLTSLPAVIRQIFKHGKATRPFSYWVHKGGGSKRRLAIPHPAAQIRICEFYRDFDGFIENLCSRSRVSLRYPSRTGSHYFESQFSRVDEVEDNQEPDSDPASFHGQRRWASTYFYYRRYTQMYKFYSSAEFSALEQKYPFLLQVDISRCFDSVYTHSIAWAVRGKEFSKNNIKSHSFEAKFDQLMHNANWSETNGILVGPEVSRVFAEIILQAIDQKVMESCRKAKLSIGLNRYIDDYLIFGMSERDVFDCKKIIEGAIAEFNLHLNESKTLLTTRPLVSKLSIARGEVHKEVGRLFDLARSSLTDPGGGKSPARFPSTAADRAINEIRKISRKYEVDYAVLASPALAVVVKGLHRLRIRSPSDKEGTKYTVSAREIIRTILIVAHFIFNMDMRAATSHKIAKVYFECMLLAKKFAVANKALKSQIVDGMRSILHRTSELRIRGPEVINLLIAVEAVCGSPSAVRENDVARALGIAGDWPNEVGGLNYFDLVSILYFSRKREGFRLARVSVVSEISRRIREAGSELGYRTEETLLFCDALSCPHIDSKDKVQMLISVTQSLTGSKIAEMTALIQVHFLEKKLGFVAWDGAKHFRALLERKELQPAYD